MGETERKWDENPHLTWHEHVTNMRRQASSVPIVSAWHQRTYAVRVTDMKLKGFVRVLLGPGGGTQMRRVSPYLADLSIIFTKNFLLDTDFSSNYLSTHEN